MKTIISTLELIFGFVFFLNDVFAQISSGGEPYSFSHSVTKSVDIKRMQQIDVNSLLEEDKITPKDLPYRFGYGFDVTYNLENSGSWLQLEDGNRLWRLHIISEGAYSINLIYDKFWLPDIAQFFYLQCR